MERKELINEIKGIYSSLINNEKQHHFSQTTNDVTHIEYYNNIYNMVCDEIEKGTFDRFQSGKAVVDAVSKDKQKWLSQWNSQN